MRKKSTFTAKVLATMAITASALLLPQQGWSRIINFEQDDIGYGLNTDTKEATVTNLRNISSTANIPDSLVYKNAVYKVTAIGPDANYRNDRIKKVVLGKYVQVIDSCAFQGNKQLFSINIPKGMKVIGGKSFQDCYALESIELPEGLEAIRTFAFYSSGLKSFHIPASVNYLGVNPVRDTQDLDTITISAANPYFKVVNGVVFSKDGQTLLFSGAGIAADSYTIPDGVIRVAPFAMRNTYKVKGLVLPASVRTLGDEAFCRMGLKTLHIGAGLKNIGECCFGYCPDLATITLDAANPILKLVDNNILSKDGKTLLIVVAQNAEYTVPAGVETIAPYVFYGMTKMTGINLNDVITIGECVFYHTDNLATVIWVTKLQEIGRMAFQYSGLTSIILPPSVRAIKYQAFTSCSKNTKIVLPEGVKEIATSAFYGNKLVKEVRVPASATNLGESIFYYCDSLQKVILPDNLTYIPKQTFNHCRALKEINYPASLREIGRSALTDCPITNFNLPETVEVIGGMAFENTKIGPEITLPPLVSVIDEFTFVDCKNLKSVTTSPNLKEIKEAGIQYNTILEEIHLNEGLLTIGRIGLAGNYKMKSLTIPSTVVSVGSLFVRSNIAQKDLIMLPASPPATNGDVTDDARYDIITQHVQKGSLEAYKQHPIWGKFTKILGDAGVKPEFMDEPTVVEIYDITGRRLPEMTPGTVNILRMSDGSVRKVMVPANCR